MKSVILNASFAFFIALSSTAQAQPAHDADASPHVVVSYSDLNLSRETGARVMLSRLQAAARSVCGGAPDIRDIGRLARYRSCAAQAMDRAVDQLGSAQVSALYGVPAERVAMSR